MTDMGVALKRIKNGVFVKRVLKANKLKGKLHRSPQRRNQNEDTKNMV